jgi:hypothetical protein
MIYRIPYEDESVFLCSALIVRIVDGTSAPKHIVHQALLGIKNDPSQLKNKGYDNRKLSPIIKGNQRKKIKSYWSHIHTSVSPKITVTHDSSGFS